MTDLVERTIGADAMQVLDAVGTGSDVESIRRETGLSRDEVAESLSMLTESGLVRLRDEDDRTIVAPVAGCDIRLRHLRLRP